MDLLFLDFRKKKSEVLISTEGYIIQCEELEMVMKD